MTDEISKKDDFKAPPMPTKTIQMPSHKTEQRQVEGTSAPVAPETENVRVGRSGLYDNNIAAELNLPPQVIQTKPVVAILAAVLAFGMILGCVMGGSGKKMVVQGLDGVVRNPHVTSGMYRCGRVDPNRECILYIMNSKKFDQSGEDFFQMAQDITGVPKYSIQLSNTNYANALIQGGAIAQIYIPARR